MSANTAPIFPLAPYSALASLAAVTACTTRAPLAFSAIAANNLVALAATSANGLRVDRISVQACSTSITAPTAAQSVLIWQTDGTTVWLIDEILVSVVTPSTTVAAFAAYHAYVNKVLPPTHSLYVSTTVTTTAATTALLACIDGGTY
jgi:hypothetical protein